MTTTLFVPIYIKPLDTLYGTLCCICFLFGILENMAELTYFLNRKPNVSAVLYRIITLNDILISLAVFTAEISFFIGKNSNPGFLFGTQVLCNAWVYDLRVVTKLETGSWFWFCLVPGPILC